MASNPFGISQVDVPGMLGMHAQMKARRLDELYRAKQIEIAGKEADLAERKAEREDRKEQALAKIFMGGAKGGDPSSGSGGVTAPTEAVPPAPPAHPLDGVSIEQPLPPRTDGMVINQEALRDLYALDPKAAMDVQRAVYDANKQQLEQVTQRGEAMAVAASALGSVPADQRAGEFQTKWAPYLLERGWTPELLKQAQLDDHSLATYYRQGRSLEKIAASAEKDREWRSQEANRAADNRRADEASARARRADARSEVRFNERALDRAAIAASGGIRTDVSDLNY